MVLFAKDSKNIKTFDKARMMAEIKEQIHKTYPDYHILDNNEGEHWDLLIIRSISREVKEIVGAFHHESVSQQRFQQVYAIVISNQPPQEDNLELIQKLSGWITQYIPTDNVESVMRKLRE